MANTKKSKNWRQAWALKALVERPRDRLPRGFWRLRVIVEGPAVRDLGSLPLQVQGTKRIMEDEANRAPHFSAETLQLVADTNTRN